MEAPHQTAVSLLIFPHKWGLSNKVSEEVKELVVSPANTGVIL